MSASRMVMPRSECGTRWRHRASTAPLAFGPRSAAFPLDVEDPYYGGPEDFEAVFTVIEASLPGLHDWIDQRLGRP